MEENIVEVESAYRYKCSICHQIQTHITSKPEEIMGTIIEHYYMDHEGNQYDKADIGKAMICNDCWNELMDSIELIRDRAKETDGLEGLKKKTESL